MQNEQILCEMLRNGSWKIDSSGKVWGKKRFGWKRIEHKTPQGYLQVRKMVNGMRVHTGAHRLVWAWVNGPIPPGITINHKNGIKTDNSPENLELATYSENLKHAFLINLKNQDGEKNPSAKLTNRQVLEIREKYATGEVTQAAIAGEYNVSFQAISKIVRGDRRAREQGPTADYSARRNAKKTAGRAWKIKERACSVLSADPGASSMISKCQGRLCDIKEECLRYTIPPIDERIQSWVIEKYSKVHRNCPNRLRWEFQERGLSKC